MAEQETVCKRCKQPIKEEATQCEHCGYSRDHGAIWNLVGLTQIFNPLGWAMLTDNLRDKKVGESKEKKSFLEQIKETNEEMKQNHGDGQFNDLNEIEGPLGQVLSLALLLVLGITTVYGFYLFLNLNRVGALAMFVLAFVELGVGMAVMNYFESTD